MTQQFQEKYIGKDQYGNYEYVGTPDERSKALRAIVYTVAREYYAKYPYKIQDMMVRPNGNYVGNNPYVAVQDNTYVKPAMEYIPVYEDGTPALLSNDDIVKSFDLDKFDTKFDPRSYDNYIVKQDNTYVHVNPVFISHIPGKANQNKKAVNPGYNKDKITTGEIGKPMLVTNSGHIQTPKGIEYIPQDDIISILKRTNALDESLVKKYEKKAPTYKKRQVFYERFDTNKHLIQENAQFFYRVFDALNVHMISLSKNYSGGQFANTEDDQLFFAQNATSQAFQAAPMLRNDYEWSVTTSVPQYHTDEFGITMPMGSKKVTKKYSLPLLYKIATTAYDAKKGTVNVSKARTLINDVINRAISNTSTQLAKFCNTNYLNYKDDSRFKEIYKASKFLRATLKSPYASTEEDAARIQGYDESIRKELRTRWQAFNEDWGEPALKILGTAALIALAIVLIVGSGGTATPGVMAGAFSVKAALAGAASTFLAVEFFISFPLVVSSAYNRINTHFYEVPAQLRFQRSLAQSQVDYSEIVDWDMLRADEKSNRTQKWMQIPLIALDGLYAGMLFRHVKSSLGYVGKGAYRRLTDVKLRGWSAPPKSMFMKAGRFKELRKSQGFFKAVKTKAKVIYSNAKMYMPKYQPLPPNMLNGVPLRMGIMKQAKKMGVASEPWKLLDDIKAYHGKLKGRITEFDSFVRAEGEVLGKVRLNGKFTLKEVMEHGMQYHKLSFIPKSYWQAVKSGDAKTFLKYLTDSDVLWSKLKHMQGRVVKIRERNIGKVITKIEDFHKGVKSGQITSQGDEMMGDLLRRLTDDEIMVLQEIAKRSKGTMSNFKTVFKDHRKVVQGLRPVSYLYGKAGVQFNPSAVYQNVIMGDVVSPNYKYKKPVEDLVNYYESMAKNYGNLSEEMRIMRREVEGDIGHHMTVDNAGNRTYHD